MSETPAPIIREPREIDNDEFTLPDTISPRRRAMGQRAEFIYYIHVRIEERVLVIAFAWGIIYYKYGFR